MFDPGESRAEFLDHVLQLVVTWLLLPIISGVTGGVSCTGISSVLRVSPTLRTLTYIHAEHHNLGGHGGHLIGEAVLINSVHMSSKGVFSIGFSLPLNCFVNTVHIGIERPHFIPDEWSSHLDLQF